MRIGLELGAFAWDGGPTSMGTTLARIARTADEAGFDLIATGDHLWQGPHAGGPEAPQLECFTTLGVLAAHTTRCRVAPVVAGVHFRHPALLAKSATTLDVLTGGRFMLGLGVGWDESEAAGSGIEFPPLGDRFTMLEETLQILLRYWTGERGAEKPYSGRHYTIERTLSDPQSVTRPHPPIMLGGGGRRTLRLVAEYADACNLYPGPDLTEKLELLRRLCDEAGRDYTAVEKTCVLPVDVTESAGVDALLTQLRQIAAAAVDTTICIISSNDPIRDVERIGERVLPAMAND